MLVTPDTRATTAIIEELVLFEHNSIRVTVQESLTMV
jgi:hypothetical protein